MSRLDLRDRVVVVTGGGNGIGRSVAKRVATRGATPVILDMDADAAAAAAREIGGRALGLQADVTEIGQLATAFETVARELGGVDVVVANAGIERSGHTVDSGNRTAHQLVIDVNLTGVWNTLEVGLPYVIDRKGHAVAVSSVAAFLAFPTMTAYCASKAGVELLMRCLRMELGSTGASCGVVHFGPVDTGFVTGFEADPIAARLQELAPGWLAKRVAPEQAAAALVDGIERRAPRVVYPPRWRVLYGLRGVLGPLIDRAMVGNDDMQEVINQARQRDRAKAPVA